jgi:hypothetical protein
MPIGTFTRKMLCQPKYPVRIPPINGPRESPMYTAVV